MVFVRLVSSLQLMYRFRSTELSATGKGRGVIDTLLLLSHQGKVLSAVSYKILSFSCIAKFFFKMIDCAKYKTNKINNKVNE